tara:strand:+ start:103 stop:633 length:531 start_codon:yes stop_codon:yes gene_type:complete
MKQTDGHPAVKPALFEDRGVASVNEIRKKEGCEMDNQTNMTKAKAEVIVEALSKDANRQRGQTHGAQGANIGGIAGCISLKKRNGAVHYVGVLKVADMVDDSTPAFVEVRKANTHAKYVVHCFAHGTQKAVPSRGAGMQSVRCAGRKATSPPTKKGVLQMWCNGCVKAMSNDDSDN